MLQSYCKLPMFMLFFYWWKASKVFSAPFPSHCVQFELMGSVVLPGKSSHGDNANSEQGPMGTLSTKFIGQSCQCLLSHTFIPSLPQHSYPSYIANIYSSPPL